MVGVGGGCGVCGVGGVGVVSVVGDVGIGVVGVVGGGSVFGVVSVVSVVSVVGVVGFVGGVGVVGRVVGVGIVCVRVGVGVVVVVGGGGGVGVVVVVVVVVVVGVVVVGVGITPAAFLLGSVVAENRQIGGVFACFCNSRSKKHRKYQCVWRIGSPKPRYLRCFLPLVVKSTVFTVFFGQHLAKILVFTEISPCSKMWFLDPKRTKILYITMF